MFKEYDGKVLLPLLRLELVAARPQFKPERYFQGKVRLTM